MGQYKVLYFFDEKKMALSDLYVQNEDLWVLLKLLHLTVFFFQLNKTLPTFHFNGFVFQT